MLPPLPGIPGIKPMSPEKDLHRLRLKAERKNAKEARPDAPRHAAGNFMGSIPLPAECVVALYHPIGDELDTEPLLDALLEADHKIALPRVAGRKEPLTFHSFVPGDTLKKGKVGVMEPDRTAPEITPDIVVVPLLGFSTAGDRLGYGGGYYDRTLAALRDTVTDQSADPGDTPPRPIIAVGYAYGAQQVDALPSGPLDQKLDWVVTERGSLRFKR
ncbi:MAG: 5-formyltetrahydrofolate cyclo-ligase [Pseudomonadota bacterium]